MRIITAITPDYMEVLRHTLPRNLEHGRVEVYRATEAYAENGAERIRGRVPCKPDILMEALEGVGRMVWLDADAWIVRPFDLDVVLAGCDVAVTMRRPVERGGTDFPDVYGYLNTGVVFLANNYAAWCLMVLWRNEVERVASRSDQEALNNIVRRVTDLTEYNKVFTEPGGVRIKVLSTDEYNWSYWPEEPGPQTRILHMKNNQRREHSLEEWTKRRFE